MIEKENPEIIMKSVKNDIETEHIRRAHLKDAAAHTKFIYWLKENIGKTEITERSASARLEEFRKEQDGYLGPSFEPISCILRTWSDCPLQCIEGKRRTIRKGAFSFNRYQEDIIRMDRLILQEPWL